jgi:hypothetical protein
MTARIERAVAQFAARRIAGQVLRRAGLMRFLPGGLVAMLLTEGLLLAWQEVRARPELRRKIWQAAVGKRSAWPGLRLG